MTQLTSSPISNLLIVLNNFFLTLLNPFPISSEKLVVKLPIVDANPDPRWFNELLKLFDIPPRCRRAEGRRDDTFDISSSDEEEPLFSLGGSLLVTVAVAIIIMSYLSCNLFFRVAGLLFLYELYIGWLIKSSVCIYPFRESSSDDSFSYFGIPTWTTYEIQPRRWLYCNFKTHKYIGSSILYASHLLFISIRSKWAGTYYTRVCMSSISIQ